MSKQECDASFRQFGGCSFPVIAHTEPQARKGTCPVVEQLFGMYMYNTHIYRIVFKLCIGEMKKNKKNGKIEMFTFGFLLVELTEWILQ